MMTNQMELFLAADRSAVLYLAKALGVLEEGNRVVI